MTRGYLWLQNFEGQFNDSLWKENKLESTWLCLIIKFYIQWSDMHKAMNAGKIFRGDYIGETPITFISFSKNSMDHIIS